MERAKLLELINDEISRLQKAARVLEEPTPGRVPIGMREDGRPTGYIMSSVGREKIAAAQKKRWARHKAEHATKVKSGAVPDNTPTMTKKRATKQK